MSRAIRLRRGTTHSGNDGVHDGRGLLKRAHESLSDAKPVPRHDWPGRSKPSSKTSPATSSTSRFPCWYWPAAVTRSTRRKFCTTTCSHCCQQLLSRFWPGPVTCRRSKSLTRSRAASAASCPIFGTARTDEQHIRQRGPTNRPGTLDREVQPAIDPPTAAELRKSRIGRTTASGSCSTG